MSLQVIMVKQASFLGRVNQLNVSCVEIWVIIERVVRDKVVLVNINEDLVQAIGEVKLLVQGMWVKFIGEVNSVQDHARLVKDHNWKGCKWQGGPSQIKEDLVQAIGGEVKVLVPRDVSEAHMPSQQSAGPSQASQGTKTSFSITKTTECIPSQASQGPKTSFAITKL